MSQTQMTFLSVLDAFSHPVPVHSVVLLSGISAGDLHSLIFQMRQLNWLEEPDGSTLGFSEGVPFKIRSELTARSSHAWMEDLLKEIHERQLVDTIGSKAYGRLQSHCQKFDEKAETAYQEAVVHIENRRYEKARQVLIDCLVKLENHLETPKNATTFISAVMKLASVVSAEPFIWDRTEELLVLAGRLAHKNGEKRNQAIINLYLAFFFHSRDLNQKAQAYFKNGIDEVNALGDEDIIAQSEEFLAYYYHDRGLYRESFSHCERAMAFGHADRVKQLNILQYFPLYFSTSASYIGQYSRAISMLNQTLQMATEDQNHFLVRFCQANLGTVMLMIGKKNKASKYLSLACEDARDNKDPLALLWALRALSYYHYLNDDIEKSYQVLKSGFSLARKMGSSRHFYASPWTLELLYEMDRHGFEPISGHDLESELVFALQDINIHQRGIAYRIRAKQAEQKSESIDTVLSLYKHSLDNLKRSSSAGELAKTYAELAVMLLNRGETAQAQSNATQAWSSLGLHNPDQFPDQLKPLIKNIELGTRNDLSKPSLLHKHIELMEDLLPVESENEMFLRMIAAISRYFDMDRGGVFNIGANGKGEPELIAGYYLTSYDVSRKQFQPIRQAFKKLYRKRRPSFQLIKTDNPDTPDNRQVYSLFIPFRSNNRPNGFFYCDSSHGHDTHRSITDNVLMRLSDHFNAFISRIETINTRIKEISHHAIVQTEKHNDQDEPMISRHAIMSDLLQRAAQTAASDASVLIQGETGVGKELMARYIHQRSPRRKMPFIAVNLSSIPEGLLESQLFGHEKGAFTGAVSRKPGLMELADRGTLFLDEVGEIPESIQIKLLRALQEKTFMRVGGIREHSSDFRIITASNRNMADEVAEGRFREDLYYRINIVPLYIPPLRERGDDIIELANHFLKKYAQSYGKQIPQLTDEDRKELLAYRWPGNVRELKNIVERAVILSTSEHLDIVIPSAFNHRIPGVAANVGLNFPGDLTLDELQKRYIQYVLKETGGKIGGPDGASAILGINRSTLYFRMKKLGVTQP